MSLINYDISGYKVTKMTITANLAVLSHKIF